MVVRPRFALWCLMLVVALVALLVGGVELARRSRRAVMLPPPPPWAPASVRGGNPVLYVNMDDVRAGIDPPRTKWVYLLPDRSYLTEDAPGVLKPGEFRSRFPNRP